MKYQIKTSINLKAYMMYIYDFGCLQEVYISEDYEMDKEKEQKR